MKTVTRRDERQWGELINHTLILEEIFSHFLVRILQLVQFTKMYYYRDSDFEKIPNFLKWI